MRRTHHAEVARPASLLHVDIGAGIGDVERRHGPTEAEATAVEFGRGLAVECRHTSPLHPHLELVRLADLGDARMWRLDRSADYGVLNGLARNRIDRNLIVRNWNDLPRLAGSLKMSTVGAVALALTEGGGRVSTLGRTLTELGRAPKTLHLLSYFDDQEQRRYIGRHLTRHESRHKLARHVFRGRKGQLRKAYRRGHGR